MKMCETCLWWDRTEGEDYGDARFGFCRRNPPVIVDGGLHRAWSETKQAWVSCSTSNTATWPLTEAEDWCGKWEGM